MGSEMQIHGHRGCPALYPENSLEGFTAAIESGVFAIEIDVVVSGDRRLVVSHEPWFDHRYCLGPNGKPIKAEEEQKLSIYSMPYDQIKRFDCGSIGHPDHPKQKKLKTRKPLLIDVIDEMEAYMRENDFSEFYYTIDAKSDPAWYGKHCPPPEEFARLLGKVIDEYGMEDHAMVCSFDKQFLNAFAKAVPTVTTGLIIDKQGTLDQWLADLDFKPDCLSIREDLLTEELVEDLQDEEFTVLAWTVNEKPRVEQLRKMGVDGVMTDYPNLIA